MEASIISDEYCPLKTNDRIGGYVADQLLGAGRYASVWGELDKEVAIKIYKRDEEKYFKNEERILQKIKGADYIIGYHGTFKHNNIYHCLVFDLCRQSVAALLDGCISTHQTAFSEDVVKEIMRQILAGLDFLHKSGIIHGDIKPDNLLTNSFIGVEANIEIDVRLADFGSSLFIGDPDPVTTWPGTPQYMAPEILIETGEIDKSIDIWSAFITCYELYTGDLIFDCYHECDVDYGDDIAISVSSDSEEINYGTRYQQLIMMARVLGPPSQKLAAAAPDYYKDGLPYDYPDFEWIDIKTLLELNYSLEESSRLELEKFLLCGLQYDTANRISAENALKHKWLQE